MIADALAVMRITNGLAGLSGQLAHYRKFKYLYYLPSPVQLPPSAYDLVADEAFCRADDRLPLLIWTQYGIFPSKASYPRDCTGNYRVFEGIGSRYIGLLRRAYLSNRENSVIQVYDTANIRNHISMSFI